MPHTLNPRDQASRTVLLGVFKKSHLPSDFMEPALLLFILESCAETCPCNLEMRNLFARGYLCCRCHSHGTVLFQSRGQTEGRPSLLSLSARLLAPGGLPPLLASGSRAAMGASDRRPASHCSSITTGAQALCTTSFQGSCWVLCSPLSVSFILPPL